jgi:hypothetical protein
MNDENFAVAESTTEWLASLEAEKIANHATPDIFFDPIVSATIGPMFDALVTGPTGLYEGRPFSIQSQTTSSLEAFFDVLNRTYDRNDFFYLLYQVQRYDPPMSLGFDRSPLTFNVRFATVRK